MICDLAEIYGIYSYRALPLQTVAVLCSGLGLRSRVMGKIAGLKVPAQTYMLAQILDGLELLAWQNTKDGHEGKNKPTPRTASLMTQEQNNELFDSPDDLEAFRARIFNAPERGD